MTLFQRQIKPHVHAQNGLCPLCEQPIGQDIARRIEARMREQQEAVIAQARAEMAVAADQAVAAARSEAKAQAEAAAMARLADLQARLAQVEQSRAEQAAAAERALIAARNEAKVQAEAAAMASLADIQARLAQAEQARAEAAGQIAALKAEQQAAVEKRVAEIEETLTRQKEDLQREKETAVLAEKAKVLKLTSELADLQRKLEGKSAHELGEGSEIDLFEQLRAAFEGDRIQRVPKGVNGADVIHEVVHNGRTCGKIVYDAKNRDAWQNGFAVKLNADKLAQGADHAILSSNKFPRDKREIHLQDGVIVAAPARVLAIVEILRDQLIRLIRGARQQRAARRQDRGPLRLHHLRALQAADRAGGGPGRQDARPRQQGAGGAPAPVGPAQEADPRRAEGPRRPLLRDRPHHRHGRQRSGGRPGRIAGAPSRDEPTARAGSRRASAPQQRCGGQGACAAMSSELWVGLGCTPASQSLIGHACASPLFRPPRAPISLTRGPKKTPSGSSRPRITS